MGEIQIAYTLGDQVWIFISQKSREPGSAQRYTDLNSQVLHYGATLAEECPNSSAPASAQGSKVQPWIENYNNRTSDQTVVSPPLIELPSAFLRTLMALYKAKSIHGITAILAGEEPLKSVWPA